MNFELRILSNILKRNNSTSCEKLSASVVFKPVTVFLRNLIYLSLFKSSSVRLLSKMARYLQYTMKVVCEPILARRPPTVGLPRNAFFSSSGT